MRLYRYVGPEDIRRKAAGSPGGTVVASAADLLRFCRERQGEGLPLVVTFVVDAEGRLRLADRRSEHVACAEGGPVLSAGEMSLEVTKKGVEVVEVSNHSTGYCPEPESWPALRTALDALSVPHPGGFTSEVVFRRCPSCGQRNVVKDGWFACGVCGSELPQDWNFE